MSAPDPLPGPSAAQLSMRALVLLLLSFGCLLLIVPSSFLPRGLRLGWAIAWAVVGSCLAVAYVVGFLRAWGLRKREIERGYTSLLDVARKQPSLYLVHYRTGQVLAGPNQPRPRTVKG